MLLADAHFAMSDTDLFCVSPWKIYPETTRVNFYVRSEDGHASLRLTMSTDQAAQLVKDLQATISDVCGPPDNVVQLNPPGAA